MRAIKFRAWNKKKKEFIYFDLNCLEILTADEIDLIGVSDIQQYIGLSDKNGIKIYEGDFVKVFDESLKTSYFTIHRVDYLASEGYPAYDLVPMLTNVESNSLAYCCQCGEDLIEVIGNIHENPDIEIY